MLGLSGCQNLSGPSRNGPLMGYLRCVLGQDTLDLSVLLLLVASCYRNPCDMLRLGEPRHLARMQTLPFINYSSFFFIGPPRQVAIKVCFLLMISLPVNSSIYAIFLRRKISWVKGQSGIQQRVCRPAEVNSYVVFINDPVGTPRKFGWGPVFGPKTLTLFMTKICNFPYTIYAPDP